MKLRKKKYDFNRANAYLRVWEKETRQRAQENNISPKDREAQKQSTASEKSEEPQVTQKTDFDKTEEQGVREQVEKGKELAGETPQTEQNSMEEESEKPTHPEEEEERRMKVEQRIAYTETPLKPEEKKKVALFHPPTCASAQQLNLFSD